ncbi:MAG: polar amino acid transport system substrate-binding protein [Paracoccaceae bacterium]|jgi:polar amino acid transport system substrate-binding protein
MLKLVLPLLATAVLALPVSAQTLERVRATGELKLGFRADAAPLSFLDQNGKPAGYSPLVCSGVAQAIANKLQITDLVATFHAVDATDRFDKVASGEIDLLCGAATITQKRREIVDFSVPIYVDGTAVMLPKDADTDLTKLAGKKVGVRSGTTTQEALGNTLAGDNITADVIRFADHRAGMAALKNGEISAYFADQSILFFLLHSSDAAQSFKVTGEIMTIEKQGLAMARGDADFRLLVDSAISELFENGTMEDLFGRALPGAEPGAAIRAMHLMSPTIP